MTDIAKLIKQAAESIAAAASTEQLTTAQYIEHMKTAIKAALEKSDVPKNPPITPDYDPDTCITAAELRAMGIEVHESVPDVGWVPRAAMRMSAEPAEHTPEDIAAGLLRMDMAITFTEPFRWIELNVQATKRTDTEDPTTAP